MQETEDKSSKVLQIIKRLLPSPFAIAISLTILTLIIAMLLTQPANMSAGAYFLQLVSSWESGLWDASGGGLYFAFQMMLILVLGHILALTPSVNRLIQSLLKYCTNSTTSVVIVSISAIIMGLINWGLGLIFGAIIARKVGEKFAKENKPLNYGLVGAAAYVTMMVWHGGLSGSATTKAMESGSLAAMVSDSTLASQLPDFIPFNETIGSTLNISVAIACLILIPLFLYILSKYTSNEKIPSFKQVIEENVEDTESRPRGAERLDRGKWFGMGLGIFILLFGIYKAVQYEGQSSLGFIQLNFINFMFLGLSLMLHRSLAKFSKALQTAVGDVSGILIQFPFYFGIIAIMKSSGLVTLFSEAITSIATDFTFPLYTFISASIVNVFVPSGGGQWAIQGPIILKTVYELGADLPKCILAMAYGDQLTNMLQPFWALPLLGITKLKPQQLLPYSFLLFALGFIIFGVALLLG